MKKIKMRKTAVAGLFYQLEKSKLSDQLDNLLDRKVSGSFEDSKILGAVVPHAGYLYSGSVAAEVYKIVEKVSPEIIVVFGPSHHKYFKGIAISDNEQFKTPIGNVDIHLTIAKKLMINPLIQLTDTLDINEHSIEVQVPFIKKIKSSAKVIPALVGEISLEEFDLIAQTFSDVLSGFSNVLFLASSDLSHFHTYDEAVTMDNEFITDLEALDIDSIISKLSSKSIEACGATSILLVERILQIKNKVTYKNISYKNSGDVLPNHRERVVGYTSGLFLGST